MNNANFSTSILVDATPAGVYNAINKPQCWWSDSISGSPEILHSEWRYHFGDNHITRLKTIELVPNERVVWQVLENYFKNAKDQTEWVGNEIIFRIDNIGGQTKLVFTQTGLVPSNDCYKNCAWAWTGFVQKSLKSLIDTGVGQLDWYQ